MKTPPSSPRGGSRVMKTAPHQRGKGRVEVASKREAPDTMSRTPAPTREPLRLESRVEPLVPPTGFIDEAGALGVEFDPGDIERLGLFLAMLLHANESLNLTGITKPDEAWNKHILDAMALVPVLAELTQSLADRDSDGRGEKQVQLQVIDVGSGGGVPGIPLAIVMPNIRMTLLEATGKKADFLSAVVDQVGLKNARVLCDRAERVGQDHKVHREAYDVAMARALGRLNVTAELLVPLVRQGGHVLVVKGAKAAEELAEAREGIGLLGARHVQTIETPTGKIVVLEKASKTPRLYPRKDGEPKRMPLGTRK